MKRLAFLLTALFVMATSVSAMSYQQARDQALFLTDKMAYELNLTDEQYEAAYEINLDYLMRIDNYDDLYGAYWRQRNLDLYYILSSWQYRTYCDAAYFYRPLYWDGGYWHFGIYARYPHRDFFYFGCPNFVITYRGGHSWYHNGGRSWYRGRDWYGPRYGGPRPGMRDRFDRGSYGTGYRVDRNGSRSWGNGSAMPSSQRNNGTRTFGNMRNDNANSPLRNRTFGNGAQSSSQSNSRSFGMPRESSTRTTVTRPDNSTLSGGSHFGNRGSSFGSSSSATPNSTFSPRSGSSVRSNSALSAPTRSFSTPSRSYSAPSNSSSHSFGNRGSSFGGSSFSGSGSSAGTRSTGGSFSGGGHFGRR